MSSRRSKSMTKDRISVLPDSLLCHILSFLSTKHAVTTSILSKRWRPLWKSVLILDVDADDYEDFNNFRNFLNSIIVSRDPTPLHSFNIKCGVFLDFDPLDVNRFVHAAMQRGLEIFDFEWLDIKFYDLLKLVPSVLSCKTLVVLKLTNLIIDEIPQLVNLPLLKTLHLDEISFTSHFVDVIKLFNGCPILENLYTSNVELSYSWHESKEEFKGFPNMVRANLMDRSVLNFPLLWLYNAKFMSIEIEVAYVYPIPTFHNLTNLELIFSNGYSWPRLVIKLLQHCPKLQNLMIVQNYIHGDAIEDEDWKEPEVVPECLSSQLRTCSLRNFIGNRCELHFAEYVMLNSKLLYTMKIISGDEVDEKENHQILKKLSSYPRGSVTCKLLYESFHEILRG